MISLLRNAMRLQAQRALTGATHERIGEVTSYNPNRYAVKVLIQPEGLLTGWVPLGCDWVGAGWGLFSPPSVGDMVAVHFVDGSFNAPFVARRFFNNEDRPLAVDSGELWIVHAKGGFFKLTNDGKVSFSDGAGASLMLNGDGSITSGASSWGHTGDISITGKVTASSDITSSGGNVSDQKSSMQAMRNVYNEHTQTVTGGVAEAPTQQMD